jgi:hypothetical protein
MLGLSWIYSHPPWNHPYQQKISGGITALSP